MAKDAARWRNENPEKHRDIYRRNNHKANLRSRFGLTVDEFNVLVALSDCVCGICRNQETRSRRLSLDHDHRTGLVRGFLCSRCNLLLGSADDNVGRLEAAVRYLKSTAKLSTSVEDPPVPMLLFCPACKGQHLDEGEFATRRHATHACQHCGMVWRPAIVPTVGVEFLPGFKNAAPPEDTP